MDLTLPKKEGIQFLKIGHFVKVAEKWEKNRDSKQGQADITLYLEQAKIKKPQLKMKIKMKEGAITEAVDSLKRDLS
jgi:NACalpha-BTF3-like transcription factor